MHRWMTRLLAIVVVVASAGCEDILFDDPERVYDGPALVEFAPVIPDGTFVRTVSFPAGSDASQTVRVRINYVAAPPSSAVTGEVAVSSESTAVQGTHFSLPGTGFTIEPGENSTEIPVDVSAAGLADGASVSILLELQEGSGFQVSPNYRTFEIQVSKDGG